ncbi:hypothetical protein SBA6_200021 [Candidatus Sulfopaludibacter sp. SbA6]|nr:hypothetical protein SBA6_200021 [Candidatus Sulfopaludibacter sp. SbA6]
MKAVVLPNIGDPREVQADWLEWSALTESQSFVSWTSYQAGLTQAGSDDALETPPEQQEDDLLEDIVNEIGHELRLRMIACGGKVGFYPYETTHEGVAYSGNGKDLTYRFLLLLSLFGKDAAPHGSHPERLFEDLCSIALHEYLGGVTIGLDRAVFGFPRRVLPKHFPNALDDLCTKLGEGNGSSGRKPAEDQKDAKLDLVAWRSFPDGRRGKLIGFGQCATGDDWTDKAFELQPKKWCELWMKDSAGVDPFASLFIPHRPGEERWLIAAHYGGVLFDRCRIAWLVPKPQGELGKEIQDWVDHVEKGPKSQ